MAEHRVAVFRVDASLQIGSGHVMRCLTLAAALRDKGWHCTFVCREHPGHLRPVIAAQGHDVVMLAAPLQQVSADDKGTVHTHWLGCSQAEDATGTAEVLVQLRPDLLVVDHYGIDAHWEARLLPLVRTLFVIDDLADRPHAGHLLLDQNAGRDAAAYRALVPATCVILAGARYALLRPEFARMRVASLARRGQGTLRRVLVFLGGVDSGNVTGRILEALRGLRLPQALAVTVVMGPTAPWIAAVAALANTLDGEVEVLSNVSDMATLMHSCDLAIGAAGSSSWERCCLGLPALIAVLADNQRGAAEYLVNQGAARKLDLDEFMPAALHAVLADLQQQPEVLRRMSRCAAGLVDGQGVGRVLAALGQWEA